MTDEAHLPAEQPRAQAPAWFPLAERDAGRPQGAGGTPRTRPQDPVGLSEAPYQVISRRADFLAANGGKRAPMPGFVLLVRDRKDGDPLKRVGYTVSKKVGNAVIRNRMKRRFRALARELLPAQGISGADHIIIGRNSGIERDYDALRKELAKALAKVQR